MAQRFQAGWAEPLQAWAEPNRTEPNRTEPG